jgi:hypothetical protein
VAGRARRLVIGGVVARTRRSRTGWLSVRASSGAWLRITAAEAADALILPDVFQLAVWHDLADGFPEFRYLGLTEV